MSSPTTCHSSLKPSTKSVIAITLSENRKIFDVLNVLKKSFKKCSIYGIPFMVFHLWCSINGVPFMVFHLWCSIYGVPFMVFHLWCSIYGVPFMVSLYLFINIILFLNRCQRGTCKRKGPLLDCCSDVTWQGRQWCTSWPGSPVQPVKRVWQGSGLLYSSPPRKARCERFLINAWGRSGTV